MNTLEAIATKLGRSVVVQALEPFGFCIKATTEQQKLPLTNELLLSLTHLAPLLLFRGFQPLSQEEMLNVCAKDRNKELLHWNFGPIMELQVRADTENYLFSSEVVPFHWDGGFHTVPSYLVFQCLQAPHAAAGGETLFCNTEMLLADASDDEISRWSDVHLTYTTEKKAHYGGVFSSKMIDRHPHSQKPILRFAEPVETELNPVTLDIAGMSPEEVQNFTETIRAKLYHPAYCYQHSWQNNDFLIADNHALVHGRHAFQAASPRHILRIQIL